MSFKKISVRNAHSVALVENSAVCRSRWLISFIILSLAILSCESIKGSGLRELEGQTVFNRVSFRAGEENKIKNTNPFSSGVLIPPGTECTIKAISPKEIKFNAMGESYVLTGWRIGYGIVNARASFYKFFAKSKETVGLDKVNPDFRDNVMSGTAKIGMTKGEVLLSLGYPAYLGKRNPTTDDSRAAILSADHWCYLKSGKEEVLLKFEAGLLTQIVGQ
jgi:hypothetical protein